MSGNNDLQVGADRVAIQDLMARYAYAVDAKRWELLDEVFLPCPDDLLANLQVPLACLRLAVCPLPP